VSNLSRIADALERIATEKDEEQAARRRYNELLRQAYAFEQQLWANRRQAVVEPSRFRLWRSVDLRRLKP
jgi:hypothetical protein